MLLKVVSVALMAAVFAPIGAQAQSIAQIGGPAELPPASYRGLQYVDSRGCVFMRVESSGAARWYPRVNAARKPVCNQARPQVVADTAEDIPAVAPKVMAAAPVAVTAVPAPVMKPKAAPMETVASRMMPKAAVTPIAPVAAARAVDTRYEAARMAGPSKGQIGCYTSAPVAEVVRLRNGGTAVMCTRGDGTTVGWRPPIYPAGSPPGVSLRDPVQVTRATGNPASMASESYPQNAGNVTAVPKGYRLAWKDGRLNPMRGKGTQSGQVAQDQIWTRDVPAKLVSEVARKKVVLPTGQTNVTLSTMSAPAKTLRSQGSALSYVQIGSFGVTSNANGAASRLQAMGLPVARARLVQSGKALQIVMAGPFGSDAEAQAALRKARQAGFGDAFLR